MISVVLDKHFFEITSVNNAYFTKVYESYVFALSLHCFNTLHLKAEHPVAIRLKIHNSRSLKYEQCRLETRTQVFVCFGLVTK